MRSRPWILVLALIVAFTALIMYHGWSIFKANERIKNYLVSQLRPVLGEKSEVARLDMALGAVHLKGIKIISKNRRYELLIHDLRIGYNIASLIKSGFRPKKAPQDILFVKPQLKIFFVPAGNDSTELPVNDTNAQYWEKVKEFDFLKSITVSRGSITYIDSLNKSTILANDINGWISTKDIPRANLRLVGKLFRSNQLNLKLDGVFNLAESKLDLLQVNLMNFQWKDRVPFFIPAYLDILGGQINGKVTLSETVKENKFDINGDFSIENGEMNIKNQKLQIRDIHLDAIIDDWDIVVKKSTQTFNGSPITIEGRIKNILNPEFDLVAHSNSFDIHKFQQELNPDLRYKMYGNSDFSFSILNSYDNPTITGVAKCSRMKVADAVLKNVRLNLGLEDSVMHIQSLTGTYNKLTFRSKGFLDFTKPDSMIHLDIFSSGMLPQNIGIASLINSYSEINLKLRGNSKHFHGINSIFLSPGYDDEEMIGFHSIIDYKQRQLKLSTSQEKGDVAITALFNLDSHNKDFELTASNLHKFAYRLAEFHHWKKILNFEKSQLSILRRKNKTSAKVDFAWKNGRENPARTGALQIDMQNIANVQKIDCELTSQFGDRNYSGSAALLYNGSRLQIKKIELENIFYGYGQIDNAGSKDIEGYIDFTHSDLSHICNIFTLDSSLVNRGTVNGSINFSGNTSNPMVHGQFTIQNGYLNNVGPYFGNILFDVKDKVFTLENFELNKNDEQWFKTVGTAKLDSNVMDFNISAEDVDLNLLFKSLTNSEDNIHGTAGAKLTMTGDPARPELRGKITVGSGRLTKIGFDSLYAELGSQDSSFAEDTPGLFINKIVIDRNDEFQIIGNGFVPYSSENDLDFLFTGKGNLLSILPDIHPFFKESESSGDWEIRLSGAPGNVEIAGGEVVIRDGYLKIGDVAPEIKNINSSIRIEQDGFVKVEYISGTVKNKQFRFTNRKSITTADSLDLVPLSVPNLGLDFGVVSIETENKGIPLHIPGLMTKGEIGSFEFTGRNDDENFYVSGPLNKPHIRGKIHLRNVNVMFPFDSVPGMKDNPVVKLLENINWNVKAVSLKDTRYENQIPSGVDKIYINLVIDSGVSGLDFSGSINDESFRIAGVLESTEGIVDYLDFDFRIQKAGAEFDRSTLIPMVYGKAEVAIADSMGNPNHVYLTLLVEDELSGSTISRGRWGKIQFQITTDNPNMGLTGAEILASLGYSGSNIREKATDIIGISTDNLLFRPLLRPFERQMERTFNLDLVRLSSRFTRNLIEMNLWKDDFLYQNSKLYLLRSTRLMVGKYLADRVFLTYTGQLEAGMNYRVHGEELGLNHTLGLEYRINPSLLLEMEYNYNSFLLQREDKRIFLRHSFPIQ